MIVMMVIRILTTVKAFHILLHMLEINSCCTSQKMAFSVPSKFITHSQAEYVIAGHYFKVWYFEVNVHLLSGPK